MKTSEIEFLLKRYFDGETTLDEEEQLRTFFCSEEVPDRFLQYREMFSYFSREARVEMSKEPSVREGMFTEHRSEEVKAVPVRSLVRNRMIFVMGIAAGILLLVGLYFTLHRDILDRQIRMGRDAELELAYTNVRQTLLTVSTNLNVGLRQAEKLKAVDKAMKELELFNKFYQYQPFNINEDGTEVSSIKNR